MTKEITKYKNPSDMLEAYKVQFEKALPRMVDPNRFVKILCTCVRKSDDLTRIAVQNPVSLLSACMEIAQSGLDPSIPNEVWLIPYGKEAKCQYGYKGLAKLAEESAQDMGAPLQLLDQQIVYSNDSYKRVAGDAPKIVHEYPEFGQERGDVVGYYAVAKNMNGKISFHEMTVDEVKEHKEQFSKAKGGPFADVRNFDAYGLKTVLRMLIWRKLSMGPKLAKAVMNDIEAETGEEVTAAVEDKADIETPQKKQVSPIEEKQGPFYYVVEEKDQEKKKAVENYLQDNNAEWIEETAEWMSQSFLKKAAPYLVSKEGT